MATQTVERTEQTPEAAPGTIAIFDAVPATSQLDRARGASCMARNDWTNYWQRSKAPTGGLRQCAGGNMKGASRPIGTPPLVCR